MLKQGIHSKIVQERVGHSSIAMTLDTYSHVIPGLQEMAAKSFDILVQKYNANLTPNKEDNNVETPKSSFKISRKRDDGSAYGIRTRDLRLERAVS